MILELEQHRVESVQKYFTYFLSDPIFLSFFFQ